MPIDRALTVYNRSGVAIFDVDETGLRDGVVQGTSRYANFLETVAGDLLAAGVDNGIWICQEGIWVLQFFSTYTAVVGGAGANITVRVSSGGTQSPSAGTAQLTATIDLTVTAPNVQHGTIIATPTQMFRGDVLTLDYSGTLTGLVGRYTAGVKRIG